MTKRYSPEQKAIALATLQASGNNVARASLETGIPQRTLYTWRHQLWQEQKLQQLQQRHTPPPPPELPEFKDDADAFTFVREHIKQELVNIVVSFRDELGYTSPYQRAIVLSQLIDRLIKLDAYIPSTQGESRLIIQYQDPDGKLYNTPIYAREYEDTYDPTQPGTPPWLQWRPVKKTPEDRERLLRAALGESYKEDDSP